MSLVTWNPNDKNVSTGLSTDNLTVIGSGLNTGIRTTVGRSVGKYYWEYKVVTAGNVALGIANSSAPLHWISSGAYGNNARLYDGNIANGDVIGVALDLDNGTIEFYKNGVSQGIAFTDISLLGVPVFPFVSNGSSVNNTSITANFGATDFNYPDILESLGRGWASYDGNQVSSIIEYLIKDSINKIYTYNIETNEIIESPSQIIDVDNFNNNGFSNPLLLTEDIWNNTFPDKTGLQLLMYIDDTTKTEATIEYNVPEYRPIDKLNNQFQIVKYIPGATLPDIPANLASSDITQIGDTIIWE